MDFAEKLQQIIKYSKLSPSSFAKTIDVDRGMVSKYLNLGNQPTFTVVANILNKYPEISAEWLMRGTGPMLLNGEVEIEETVPSTVVETKVENAIKVVNDTVSQINEVKLDFYMKDNNRLQIEIQELRNKLKKLEDRNILLQDKLLEKI